VCSTLHELVVPAVRNFEEKIQPTLATAALWQSKIASIQRQYGPPDAYDTAGARVEGDLLTLPAANLDQSASLAIAQLHEIDRMLQESYKKYPRGTNLNVDTLRQRVQNLVDLQRAYANRLQSVGDLITDNGNGAVPNPFDAEADSGAAQRADEAYAQAQSAFAASRDPDKDPAVLGYTPAQRLRARSLRQLSVPALFANLHSEEVALVPAALAAIRDCDPPAQR